MRPSAAIAGILVIGIAALSESLGAQQSPTLTPGLKFEVAAVKKTTTRAPMSWQPGGHFTQGLPLISMVSIGKASGCRTLRRQASVRRAARLGGGASFTGGAAPLAAFVGMLQAGRGPVEVLVIDRLEMPTEN